MSDGNAEEIICCAAEETLAGPNFRENVRFSKQARSLRAVADEGGGNADVIQLALTAHCDPAVASAACLVIKPIAGISEETIKICVIDDASGISRYR